VPEIVEDGLTGMIVESMDEAIMAAPRSLRSTGTGFGAASKSVFPRRGWPRIT